MRCAWCANPENLVPKQQVGFISKLCQNCGRCQKACPNGAILPGEYRIDREKCTACIACVDACFYGALVKYGNPMSAEEVFKKVRRDKMFYETSGGGVTVSGGEPMTQADFVAKLFKLCHDDGINTCIETCGYAPSEGYHKVIPYTDIFLYDIKAFEKKTHKAGTGKSNQKILENLTFLDDMGCKIEIRIPLVPGYNDEEIDAIAKSVNSLKNITKVEILPYHNLAGSKYQALGLQNKMTARIPTEKEVFAAKEKFIK